MQLIEFVGDNIEWIFSGIGVAILAGGAAILKRRISRQQSIKGGVSSTYIQTGDASMVTVSSITRTERTEEHGATPIMIPEGKAVIHKTRIYEGDYQEFVERLSLDGDRLCVGMTDFL